jgi:hypothetical protein
MVSPPARLARISRLLDEAREELESSPSFLKGGLFVVSAHAKIGEAQRLLLTDEPETRPGDN